MRLGTLKSLVHALFCLFALISCERRNLEDEMFETALIPVSIIWDDAGLNPQNDPNHDVYSASVWLFAKDGATPFQNKSYKEFKLSDPEGGTIEVPIGRYAVLVFNNTVADYSSRVAFRGTENYETFEYYLLPDTRSRYQSASQEYMASEPDKLAVLSLEEFSVTRDMLVQTRSGTKGMSSSTASKIQKALQALTALRPHLLTPRIKVLSYVKGLDNASSAIGSLQGMASSVFLASGRTTNTPSSYLFSFVHPTFDNGSLTNGTIESEFNSLGSLYGVSATYSMTIRFVLQAPYNGSVSYPPLNTAPYGFDVTDQVSVGQNKVSFTIEVGTPTPLIDLPLVNKTDGMGIGVGNWGPNINVPMN